MRSSIASCLALILAVPAIAAPTAEQKCEISKNQIAGRYAACRQAAVAAAIKKQAAPDFSKCDAQFGAGWDKAEAKAAKQGVNCPDASTDSEVGTLIEDHSETVAAVLAGNAPPPDPVCGNGVVEAGEECDLTELGGATCASELPNLACASGAVSCSPSCTLDLTDCTTDANCAGLCAGFFETLTSPGRNAASEVEHTFCDQGVSDDFLGSGWYRFEEGAGTRMPEAPPATNSCDTHAPGWLNGSHPSVPEGIVDREVCFNWAGNQCNWTSAVKVLNCGGFYLYFLPDTPDCALRYCGETPPL